MLLRSLLFCLMTFSPVCGTMLLYEEISHPRERSLADIHLYDGIRHELQSDPRHEEIFNDMLKWMKNHMEEPQTVNGIY